MSIRSGETYLYRVLGLIWLTTKMAQREGFAGRALRCFCAAGIAWRSWQGRVVVPGADPDSIYSA